MLARIAVDAAVYAIDKPWSYRIPPGMTVEPGMRVSVPFGRGNRRCEGIVLSLESGDEDGLKCIDQRLDESPVLSEEGLRIAAFVRERYFCTFYEAIKAMLPAGLWFRTSQRIVLLPGEGRPVRNAGAARVVQLLEDLGGEADYAFLRRQLQSEDALQAALRYLSSRKRISVEAELARMVSDKTERVASLIASAEETMAYAARRRKAAPVQYAVLELLCTVGSASTKEICYFTGAALSTLRRLESLGYLELTDRPALRRVAVAPEKPEPLTLTEEQQAVFDGLCGQWDRETPGAALLYGVTGSGKTAVYLKLIQRCLARGCGALLLVPEIALTPRLLGLLAAHFGERVAVLHSGLRVGERYDEWRRIRSGEARVVVGTRSAVFAPVCNLNLILVDEEQEHTYKSENSPRYHARAVALYRGVQRKALVVLGSATPSVETMYHAQRGDLTLYRLPHRFNGRALPPVELVDMKQELRAGNSGSISARLEEKIRENLGNGRQTILFLNRRGASRFVACVDCGSVPQCPRCSVHLTYHAANGRLMCHYCGHSEPLPVRCPICGGSLKQVGAGTQRVVEELERRFPGVEVLRMDADTVSAVHSHEQLLGRFQKEKIPILVGTQMVAKGLDFENVTLVSALDADQSLYVGSYRAAETTFSLLAQVSGRAGRGMAEGSALIQTMTPENAVLQLAAAQDYDRFYAMEIGLRHLRGSPPFRDLTVVTFSAPFEDQASGGAQRFRQELMRMLQEEAYRSLRLTVLGPAPAPVVRVNNRYRYRLTVCCPNSRLLRSLVSGALRQFALDRRNRGVTAFADSNPVE